MRLVLNAIDKLSGTVGIATAWLVVPLIFATVYEVTARYVFGAPTIWAFEIGYMAMGTHFLLGSAYALREGSHIRVDVAYTHFSPRVKALVDIVGYTCLFIPVSTWLCYRLYLYAWDAYQSGELSGQSAWNPVIWPFRVVFLAGFALLTLQALAELAKRIRVLVRGGTD